MRPTLPSTSRAPNRSLLGRVLARSQRVLLAHVDGAGLGGWPLGQVVRREGGSFRVTRHRGVPPGPGQVDWTFDVWGVQLP